MKPSIPFTSLKWSNVLSDFPCKEDLLRAHELFLKLELEELPAFEVKRLFFDHYRLFILGHSPVVNLKEKGSALYRARWIDVRKENANDPKTYSYPRKEIAQRQRANQAMFPVFYASPSEITSILEIGTEGYRNGKNLFVGRWKHSDNDTWIRHPILPGMVDNPWMSDYDGRMQSATRKYLIEGGSPRVDDLICLNDCFSELFLSKNIGASSWIAHELLYTNNFGDEVQYPSIAASKGSICSAIRPFVIDKGRLVLECVLRINVNRATHEDRAFELDGADCMIGIPTNAGFDWHDASPEEIQRYYPVLARGYQGVVQRIAFHPDTKKEKPNNIAVISSSFMGTIPKDRILGLFEQEYYFEAAFLPLIKSSKEKLGVMSLSLNVNLQHLGVKFVDVGFACVFASKFQRPVKGDANYKWCIDRVLSEYNRSIEDSSRMGIDNCEALLIEIEVNYDAVYSAMEHSWDGFNDPPSSPPAA